MTTQAAVRVSDLKSQALEVYRARAAAEAARQEKQQQRLEAEKERRKAHLHMLAGQMLPDVAERVLGVRLEPNDDSPYRHYLGDDFYLLAVTQQNLEVRDPEFGNELMYLKPESWDRDPDRWYLALDCMRNGHREHTVKVRNLEHLGEVIANIEDSRCQVDEQDPQDDDELVEEVPAEPQPVDLHDRAHQAYVQHLEKEAAAEQQDRQQIVGELREKLRRALQIDRATAAAIEIVDEGDAGFTAFVEGERFAFVKRPYNWTLHLWGSDGSLSKPIDRLVDVGRMLVHFEPNEQPQAEESRPRFRFLDQSDLNAETRPFEIVSAPAYDSYRESLQVLVRYLDQDDEEQVS